MSTHSATLAHIGAQFGIEDWNASVEIGPQDPTDLESVPLVPDLMSRGQTFSPFHIGLSNGKEQPSQVVSPKGPQSSWPPRRVPGSTRERQYAPAPVRIKFPINHNGRPHSPDPFTESLSGARVEGRTQEAVDQSPSKEKTLSPAGVLHQQDTFSVLSSSQSTTLPVVSEASSATNRPAMGSNARFPRQLLGIGRSATSANSHSPQESHIDQSASRSRAVARIDTPSSAGQTYYQSQKDLLLQNLQNVAAPTTAGPAGTRSVMYDPAVSSNHSPRSPARQTKPSSRLDGTKTQPPGSSSDGYKLTDLVSSSVALDWRERPVHIYTEEVGQRTVDELRHARDECLTRNAAEFERPSAVVAEAARHARATRVDEWWKRDERSQDTLRTYLIDLADRELDPAKRRRDPDDPDDEEPTAASDVANRLLIPLLGTLHHYVTEPSAAQRGNWGSYAAVPEWCVDTSINGLVSFFGEDWGAPPARVGRDPRYRPVMPEPRYTAYEERTNSTVARRAW
ncbi:MAG: hypothetical protein M1817_004652 [Caeruleum heppii]|nr:MAG: hypothetical protein M1817_004652 [Caeruleum heppii]